MRLKQVILNDFKSYMGKTIVNVQHGKTVLVGRNGSGKSNIFQAIDFIMGSRNAILKQSERFRFFNNGRDSVHLFVEIVLEDEGGIFDEDLRIRRVLTAERDQYYVNGRKTNRKQLTILLEVLGCPYPRPFYFMSYSLMKIFITTDSKSCYNALMACLGQGISNTSCYMEHFLEFLEVTQAKVEDFQKLMKNVKPDKIDKLERRTKEYKALQHERATILVVIHSRNIDKLKRTITVESERFAGTFESAQRCTQDVRSLKCSVASTKLAVEEAKHKLTISKLLTDEMENEKMEVLRNKEKLFLKIQEAEKNIALDEGDITAEGNDESIHEIFIGTNKTDAEKRMEEMSDNLRIGKFELESLKMSLNEKELARDDFLLKHGILSKLISDYEITNWIEEEKKKIKEKLEVNSEDIVNLQSKYSQVEESLVNCVSELNEHMDGKRQIALKKAEGSSLKQKIAKLHVELNEQYRHVNLLQNDSEVLMKNVKSKQTELKYKIGASVLNGFDSVKKIRASWRLSGDDQSGIYEFGCYGTVVENIKCDKGVYCAIDAAIGTRLFMQIVQSDTIGTAILREMKELSYPGEVTFLPLNRLKPTNIPRIDEAEAQPLLTLLEYPEAIHDAISFLFGAVVLCRNLEVATLIARKYYCICVTLDGDRVFANGPISGGFVDLSVTIVSLYSTYQSAFALSERKSAELHETRFLVNSTKSSIDAATSRLHLNWFDTEIVSDFHEKNKQLLQRRIDELKKEADYFRNQIKKKETDHLFLIRRKRELENMEKEQLRGGSHALEVQIVQQLNKDIFDLTKTYNTKAVALAQLESKFNLIEQEVACSKEISLTKTDRIAKLEDLRRKLSDYNINNESLSSQLAVIERKKSELAIKLQEHQCEVEVLETNLESLKQQLSKKKYEKSGLNLSLTKERIMDYERKVEEELKLVNPVIEKYKLSHLERYDAHSVAQLQNRLAALHLEIQSRDGVCHISERALQRKMKLRKIHAALRELENDLCHSAKVDETQKTSPCLIGNVYLSILSGALVNGIYITVNNFLNFVKKLSRAARCVVFSSLRSWVQNHIDVSFTLLSDWASYFFKLIVPSGSLTMALERSPAEEEPVITGVSYLVKFLADSENAVINHLSTGQRVVLLASVVFALLKISPINFCVLDEVDQSLTSGYIDGLERAISLFPECQFLISSHNCEVVNWGDVHFAVNFTTKSHIAVVGKCEALRIIESLGDGSRRASTSLFLSSSASQTSESSLLPSSPTSHN